MSLLKQLNIKHPIIQAPMAGGPTTANLIAAVSNEGGLGSMGAGYYSCEKLEDEIKKVKELTDKPYQINLLLPCDTQASDEAQQKMLQLLEPFYQKFNLHAEIQQPPFHPKLEQQMEIILSECPPIFSFTFRLLEKHWIKKLKQKGIFVLGTATTPHEAKLLEELGVDAIVVQGYEAGGHRGTFAHDDKTAIGLFSLIPQTKAAINLPVIAAGGIANASGIRAAMTLGANACQLGTAFLCCDESGASEIHKQKLTSSEAHNTELTKVFSGKYARAIKNEFTEEMREHNILPFDMQNSFTRDLRGASGKANNSDYMSMWAGQSLSLCKRQSVKELMRHLLSK